MRCLVSRVNLPPVRRGMPGDFDLAQDRVPAIPARGEFQLLERIPPVYTCQPPLYRASGGAPLFVPDELPQSPHAGEGVLSSKKPAGDIVNPFTRGEYCAATDAVFVPILQSPHPQDILRRRWQRFDHRRFLCTRKCNIVALYPEHLLLQPPRLRGMPRQQERATARHPSIPARGTHQKKTTTPKAPIFNTGFNEECNAVR